MATREQIGLALKRADAAGDVAAARKLAAAYKSAPLPKTTPGGVAGAAARGLAPYAAGAATGAGLGSLFAGVGAIPGAAAGAGAVALTDLAGSAYNYLAGKLGGPQMKTPTQATGAALDAIGTERPDTSIERIAQAGAQTAGGVGATSALANQVARTATNPVTQGVAEAMATRPGLATTSGAMSGVSGQAAAEMGAPPWLQTIASVAGGLTPYVGDAARNMVFAPPKAQAVAAHQAGYVLPPNMASDRQSFVSRIMSGWAGKTKLQQAASAKNQEVTNRLASRSIGLPDDEVITEAALGRIRGQAGKAYEAVSNSIPEIKPDRTFRAVVGSLGGRGTAAARDFPGIAKNPEVDALSQQLAQTARFTPAGGVQMVRILRAEAATNFKAFNDPVKQTLAKAQRQAAEAIDDLIERNLLAAGKKSAVQQYRDARQLIARTHDIESALNTGTNDVSARELAKILDKGRPLGPHAEASGRAGLAFPKATQNEATFGDVEPLSVLDMLGAAGSVATGHHGVGAALLGRPIARSAVLSGPYQRTMMRGNQYGFPSAPFVGGLLSNPNARK